MTRKEHKVETYMSPSPITVRGDDTLEHAQEMMKHQGFRHLPVLDALGKLLGVLSERDVRGAMALRHPDPSAMRVEDVCASDAYVTEPDASLKYVAQEMAEQRYGSTVVMRSGKVVGILTTTDIARALATLLP